MPMSPLSWLGTGANVAPLLLLCASPPADSKVGEAIADPRLRFQAWFDCSECDSKCREDQKDGSGIAHDRTRSAQCSSARLSTIHAIAIHCVIILASYVAWLAHIGDSFLRSLIGCAKALLDPAKTSRSDQR
jgi:hypothetical protein